MTLVSVVTPVFNEEANIELFFAELKKLEESLSPVKLEIIFVNDGSADKSYELLKSLCAGQTNTCLINLARNYGMEAAVMAGLRESRGDCVTFMGCDFQEKPSLILELFSHWKEGYKIVWAARSKIEGQTDAQRFFPNLYWRLVNFVTGDKFPKLGADTALMDRLVVNQLTDQLHRNAPLLLRIAESGFPSTLVSYVKAARLRGQSGWTFPKKLGLVGQTLLFSPKPFRVVCATGFVLALATTVLSLLGILVQLLDHHSSIRISLIILFLGIMSLVQIVAVWLFAELTQLELKQLNGLPRFIVSEVTRHGEEQ